MVNPKVATVHDDVIKSAEDARAYRGLELTNGLKVLLISDPTTDKSSAALDVHIGQCCRVDLLVGGGRGCLRFQFDKPQNFTCKMSMNLLAGFGVG